ncbi:Hypothetical protein NTJ_07270 [Nesidiocoris tenuis]|uniref:MD-2-related lipid-recognition domain-containing protein n=1 Tax=Nesidiocoris tenuis TaxID=355587 RepID=A0ABN7AQG6_9HEMI|nr:Hypothetical protein NTJ_07270 [Nesidiocoris tenuis]
MLVCEKFSIFCYFLCVILWEEAGASSCVFESIQDCLETENNRKCDARNLTVGVLESGKWAILGKLYVDLDGIPLTKFELTRCLSRQQSESCMYFASVSYKDGCQKVEAKGEMWSSFLGNAEPEMKCPIKGEFSLEKSFIDLEANGLPALEGFYWKVKMMIYQQGKPVCCVQIDVTTGKSQNN